jgi:hypothetical protein
MPESARLVTAEELEKYPDDDYRYELVAGRVIRMSPVRAPDVAFVRQERIPSPDPRGFLHGPPDFRCVLGEIFE